MDESPCEESARPVHFGDRLVVAMRLRGHDKAAALASALGVNEAAISRWKRGGPITLSHAVRLCDTLDVSMDWLVRGIGHPLVQERTGHGGLPPEISRCTVNELRTLLRFLEHRVTGEELLATRVARDASDGASGASDAG